MSVFVAIKQPFSRKLPQNRPFLPVFEPFLSKNTSFYGHKLMATLPTFFGKLGQKAHFFGQKRKCGHKIDGHKSHFFKQKWAWPNKSGQRFSNVAIKIAIIVAIKTHRPYSVCPRRNRFGSALFRRSPSKCRTSESSDPKPNEDATSLWT